MKKKFIFVGSRYAVLSILREDPIAKDCMIMALENSSLVNELTKRDIEYEKFSMADKQEVIEKINSLDFDILISNGCPFILPVSRIRKPGQLFINIHPAYLPYLKGKHPVNGLYYNQMDFMGATMHYMDDGIDSGNIIYQEKIPLTDDLDLGLLYYISFELEKDVFEKGLLLLKQSYFDLPGSKQEGEGSFFNRGEKMMAIDIKNDRADHIIRVIKSFGIQGQGVKIDVSDKRIIVYEAERISNTFLLEHFNEAAPGTELLQYDSKIIIKVTDGLIKLKSFVVRND